MVQNLICFFHCYWTDMFQGRHFLGIWKILHVGKGTVCSKRPTSPWKISWKNNMHPHTHEHACANRASSKTFLRKTWMIVMTSYPNIQFYTLGQLHNQSKVCSSNLPPELCHGVENTLFLLWFFHTRKTTPKKTGIQRLWTFQSWSESGIFQMVGMGRSENFPGTEFSEQGQQFSLPWNLTQQFYLQLLVEILTACV